MPRKVKLIKAPKGNEILQGRIDEDEDFARCISMAAANGLPKDLYARYHDYYYDSRVYGYEDMVTMVLTGKTADDWLEFFREVERDIADMIIDGENPRIEELGLDKKKTKKEKKQKKRLSNDSAETEDVVVTAKEGDAYRKQVRELCENMSWSLSENGGRIQVEDIDEVIAVAEYRRGTKNSAWKKVYEFIEVLT